MLRTSRNLGARLEDDETLRSSRSRSLEHFRGSGAAGKFDPWSDQLARRFFPRFSFFLAPPGHVRSREIARYKLALLVSDDSNRRCEKMRERLEKDPKDESRECYP